MKRPKQHEIDSAARRLFQNSWPDAHPLRKQDEDYGIDFEVEIFKDGESTGAIFKIQLKGSRRPNYSVDGEIISFNLELNRVEYLIEQIEIPTAIILCDTTKKLVYWNVLHLDQRLRKEYENRKKRARKTITVHFETCNKLPDTIERLLNAFYKAGDFLALKHGAKINEQAYSEIVQNIDDTQLDLEIRCLHKKMAIANREEFYRRLDRQQKLRDLARKEGYWVVGEGVSYISKLSNIATGMLKNGEKIEAMVAGSYAIETSSGKYEIFKGFFAATNHRILVVLDWPQNGIRKDSFTFGQLAGVSLTSDKNSISLLMPDEVITLFDVINDLNDLEKFFKYIADKRKPPDRTVYSVKIPKPMKQ